MQNEIKKLQKENKSLKTSGSSSSLFMENYEDLNGIRFYNLEFNEDIKDIRLYADTIKERVKDSVAIMISKTDLSNSILAQVTGKAESKELVKECERFCKRHWRIPHIWHYRR